MMARGGGVCEGESVRRRSSRPIPWGSRDAGLRACGPGLLEREREGEGEGRTSVLRF